MQAVRTIQKPENGQLMIQVPEHFHDIELEVIILPAYSVAVSDEQELVVNRLELIAHLKGSIPNLPYSKYDFYEQ